jgi:hypothetical protein
MTDEDAARSAICSEFERVGAALARARKLAIVLGGESDIADLEERVVGIKRKLGGDQQRQTQ